MGEALSQVEVHSSAASTGISEWLPQPGDLAWCAVQTGYRYEQKIAGALATKGFETYVPLLSEIRQWKDRKKRLEVPAFSGYLFVKHDFTLHDRVKILQTSGVVRMLGDNQRPVPVPNFEIDALRRTLDSGVPCERHEFPAVGTVVRVKRGALAGIEGTLLRVKSGLRLVLAISTVAQAISVEVHLEDVESIPMVPGQ